MANEFRRRVVKAHLRSGSTIIANPSIKYHFWSLELECGHEIERRVRWLPQTGLNRRRGWSAQHHGVPLSRTPPEPQHVDCEECRRLAGVKVPSQWLGIR